MSKYDLFWTQIRGELESAIQESSRIKSAISLKLIKLTDQGNRSTWYARGIIGADNPDNMAHGTSLANCLTSYARENRLIVDYAVSKDGREVQLTARCTDFIPLTQPTHPRPVQVKLQTVCGKPSPTQVPVIAANPPIQKQRPQNQETSTVKKLEGKTLIILPCCIQKNGEWPYPPLVPAVPYTFTKSLNLIRGDRPPRNVPLSPRNAVDPTPALWLYKGRLYGKLDKAYLHTAMEDWLDIVILSGGYGITHAYEPIVPYEAPMPKYFRHWIKADLPYTLRTYIEETNPNNVIAFFSYNANKQKSYGDILCQGAGKVNISGILGKYVANKTDLNKDGSGKANTNLGDLVMKVVRTKTLIEDGDIPFRPPCWFPPS